jgi:hypothetical protein
MLGASNFFPTYQMNTFIITIFPDEIAGCLVDTITNIPSAK